MKVKRAFGSFGLVVAGGALWLLLGTAAPGVYGQTGKFSIAEVEKVWRARQERIRSLKIAWSQKVAVEKGAWMDPDIEPEVKARGVGPMPPTAISFESKVLVALDGEMMRYEVRDFEWSVTEGKLVPRTYISTYDGKVPTIYFPVDSNRYPQAALTDRKSNEDYANVNVRPVLLFCRPLAHECLRSNSLSTFAVVTDAALVDGRRCLVLESGGSAKSASGPRIALFVDCERDCTVLRYTLGRTDPAGMPDVSYQVEVSYRKEDTLGWVPCRWKHLSRSVHKIYSSAEVAELWINPTIDPAEFSQTEFAPGTWVFDRRTDQHWLVRKDGSKRPIAQEELGLPYEKLLNSDPGESLAPALTPSPRWFTTLNLLVLFSALGFLIYRLSLRRFRKRT